MKMSNIMSKWEIGNTQVHCVVRDNGSNIVKAISEEGYQILGASCTHCSWLFMMDSYHNLLLLICYLYVGPLLDVLNILL